mmetsp:Transcript_23075/g.58284  ORF Transcript_23075/g.58284 Transcript_23075/m.58284 type:complete len:379 (+) Transcript_23075:1060-2196(+)
MCERLLSIVPFDDVCLSLEGDLAGQHRVEDNAEGPHVHLVAELALGEFDEFHREVGLQAAQDLRNGGHSALRPSADLVEVFHEGHLRDLDAIDLGDRPSIADAVIRRLTRRLNAVNHGALPIGALRDDAEARGLNAGRLERERAMRRWHEAGWENHLSGAHELGRHDLRGSHATPADGSIDNLGHPEVDQLHGGVLCQLLAANQNVLALEVSVNDITPMQEREAGERLVENVLSDVLIQATALLDDVCQLTAMDYLHHHHLVLSLSGAGAEGIKTAQALSDVVVALHLRQHIDFVLDGGELFFAVGVHEQAPDGNGFASVLGAGVALLVALVHGALPADAEDLVRLDLELIALRPEDLELLDGAQGPQRHRATFSCNR